MDVLAKPQIICHVEKSLNYTVHDVKWIPSSAKFVSLGGKSDGSGIIELYELCSEGVKKVGEFGKKEHFKCGTFEASNLRNRHLATGDFCGRLQNMTETYFKFRNFNSNSTPNKIYKPNLNAKRMKNKNKSKIQTKYAKMQEMAIEDVTIFCNRNVSTTLLKFPDILPFTYDHMNCCQLHEMGNGLIGRISVRKSGLCEMIMGGLKFCIDTFDHENDQEELVSIDSNKIVHLGYVDAKMIISPNWFSIVCKNIKI